jgi:hypothetical protein
MRGVVAAADVATLEADAQMKPRLARDEAVLTAVHSIRQYEDLNVRAMAAKEHQRRRRPAPTHTGPTGGG